MNNSEKRTPRYKLFGYEITDETDFMDKEYGITPQIKVLILDLYYDVQSKKRGVINKLLKNYKEISSGATIQKLLDGSLQPLREYRKSF